MDNIECFYDEEDWINLEEGNKFFTKEVNEFIDVKFYPYSINKSDLYKIIYYDKNVNLIHDINQSKIDIPRYSGFIRKKNLEQFNCGELDFKTLNSLLQNFYNKNQIIDIFNMIPQQIFFIILKDILLISEEYCVTKTIHQLIIESDYVERILKGIIYENGEETKKFISKIKLNYNSEDISIYINIT